MLKLKTGRTEEVVRVRLPGTGTDHAGVCPPDGWPHSTQTGCGLALS